MTKGPLLYEGKGKKVFAVNGEAEKLWLEFKDSLTAFNAQKLGSFADKGAVNRDITSLVFRFLRRQEISSHWVEDIGKTEMITRKLTMIPLEVVVRNRLAGSTAKKFAIQEGTPLRETLVEYYYKKDELADPFISDDQAVMLNAATHAELAQIKRLALKVNEGLKQMFSAVGIELIDFKLEFGKTAKGEILLGDEITPDSCRLWDEKTQEKMDKDRFRRDLGGVQEGYNQVLNRLMTKWGNQL